MRSDPNEGGATHERCTPSRQPCIVESDHLDGEGDPFGGDDPRAFGSAEEGVGRARRAQTSGARAPPSEKRFWRKQCDLPLTCSGSKRNVIRERGNVLDDGLNVCVLERERPEVAAKAGSASNTKKKAQEDTRQQRASRREIPRRSHDPHLLHVRRRDHARQPLVTRRVVPAFQPMGTERLAIRGWTSLLKSANRSFAVKCVGSRVEDDLSFSASRSSTSTGSPKRFRTAAWSRRHTPGRWSVNSDSWPAALLGTEHRAVPC